MTTIAGRVGESGFKDGEALEAQFNGPLGLALSSGGDMLLICDSGNHRISKLSLTLNLTLALIILTTCRVRALTSYACICKPCFLFVSRIRALMLQTNEVKGSRVRVRVRELRVRVRLQTNEVKCNSTLVNGRITLTLTLTLIVGPHPRRKWQTGPSRRSFSRCVSSHIES